MAYETHVLQLSLTPAGMREPRLSEGSMYVRMYIVPEIMRDDIAAATMLTRSGYKLARALGGTEYQELINGLLIPNASVNRWDGFQESEIRQLEAALLEQRSYTSTALPNEIGRALADRRGE